MAGWRGSGPRPILAWPSGAISALAYPRQGSSATLATRASQSRGQAPSQPSTAPLVRPATKSSSRPPFRSTRPVTHRVGARRVAFRKLVSSIPGPPPPPDEQGHPPAGCRAQPRPTSPSPSQPPGHLRPPPPCGRRCRPADRPRRGPARSAPPADRSRPIRSVQVRTSQAGSPQRQIRFRHHSTTGRPPIGRSRTWTVRRPWSSARTPQPMQPTTVAVVWTASRHSPPTTSAART
jgi:hypothetical protein